MGSPALEAMSPNSTVRRIRKADAVGRLRARADYYLWFSGQIHAKQLLIYLHFFLLLVSVYFMCAAASDEFTGFGVPGLDGFPSFDLRRENQPNQETDTLYVSTATTIERPFIYASRNIVSGLGYFFLFSTLMGLAALRAVDGVWQHESVTSVRCTFRALLLIPFLLSMVSFGAGLFLWSLRAIRMRFHAISHARVDVSVFLLVIESFRFVFLPCALVWAVYLYFIYGCMLGFVFVYRRSQQSSFQRNRTGTVNSASWSFKDRSSVVSHSSEGLNIKQGFFSRLSIGNHSWHSYKCTDNPTLRSYKMKEDRSLSLLSEEVNVSLGSETSENNNLSRSFCGFNSSYRPLDTVHEENESQGNTLVESEKCATPNVKTRM